MELVKLKKDVDFNILLEYGFKYNKDTNRYERELKWTLEDVYHQLVVDIETRDVYVTFAKTTNINEELIGTEAHLYSITLLKLYPYLEIVEDSNFIQGLPISKGE